MKIFKFFSYFIFILNITTSIYAQTESQCFEAFIKLIEQSSLISDYSINSICKLKPYVECDSSATKIQSLDFVQNSATLISDQFVCFKDLKKLSLSKGYFEDDFLSNENYFTKDNITLVLNSPQQFKIPHDLFSSKINSFTLYLDAIYTDLISNQFSLDIFNTMQNINLIDLTGGKQIITFTGATKQSTVNRNISLFSKNLPPLGEMSNVGSLSIDLQSELISSSLSNYYSYSSVLNSIQVNSNVNQDICFTPAFIESQEKMNIDKLKLRICLANPNDRIDLSINYDKLTQFEIQLFSNNFDQEFPVSKVPQSLSSFKIINSKFNTLIQSFQLLANVSTVDLSSNSISDQALPAYTALVNNKLFTLNISNNQLTGTLDSSYCKIPNLIISNNQIEGNLNNCFLCYMKDQTIASNFANNKFSNINSIGNSCFGKVIPRLILDKSINRLYMKGLNLGFGPSRISTSPPLVWNLQQASTSYYADYSNYKDSRQLFNIKYEIPSLEFTLRATPIQFVVTEFTSFPNSTIIFKGMDFNYDVSLVKIEIGSYSCKMVSATFSTLECILVDPSNIPIVISDGTSDTDTPFVDLITTISITNPDDNLNNFYLQFTTSFNSTKPLNVKVTPCPNLCNNNGICYSSGQCKCTKPIVYDIDCKTGTNCTNTCGLGHCDYSDGKCDCPPNWTDQSCSTPLHYINSIDPCTVDGGRVVFHGWFSQFNTDLTIKIGSLDCDKKSFNETTIECDLGAGTGTKDVNITQNGIQLYLKNKFQYLNSVQSCPGNCTSPLNGECNALTGICSCFDKWVGYDCSINGNSGGGSNTNGNTTIDNNGTTTISNNGDGYQISILSLVELDIGGSQVKAFYFNNSAWNIKVNKEKNLYNFSQKLINSECTVSYSIEEVKESSKEFEFAGLKFKVDQGGIKLAVNISNYQYSSSLNTLQLRIQSESIDQMSNDDCNKVEAETDTSNVDPNYIMNYISLKKNNKILNGRFINKAITDNRVTYMSTEVVKELSNSTSIVLGLNLPTCLKECLIDPDFSLLLSSDYKSKCEAPRPNWFLPVVIAVPIGGLIIIIIASIILIKKYKYSIKLLMHSSIKLKERNQI